MTAPDDVDPYAVGGTYVPVWAWVLRVPGLTATDAITYGLLATYRGRGASGECWPSYARIARDLGVREDTARSRVRRLRDLGLVDVEVRPGMTSRYMFRRPEDVPGGNHTPGQIAPGSDTPRVSHTPGAETPPGVAQPGGQMPLTPGGQMPLGPGGYLPPQVDPRVDPRVDPPKPPGLWKRYDSSRASEYLDALWQAWGRGHPSPGFRDQQRLAEKLQAWCAGLDEAERAERLRALVAWTRRKYAPEDKIRDLLHGDWSRAVPEAPARPTDPRAAELSQLAAERRDCGDPDRIAEIDARRAELGAQLRRAEPHPDAREAAQ